MKSAKELCAGFYRGDELAKRVSACKRLATEISSACDGIGLTERESQTLNSAASLLREMAAVYNRAAATKKAAEAARDKWVKSARAAMKDTFETLVTTPDKVALIGLCDPYAFAADRLRGERGCWEAEYLMTRVFQECLNSLAYGLCPRTDGIGPSLKDVAPAAAVAAEWQRFVERRVQLQDKYAHLIVLVDRVLTQEKVS